ncbi:hypothetical protein D3C78_1278380 [compost metagenome]
MHEARLRYLIQYGKAPIDLMSHLSIGCWQLKRRLLPISEHSLNQIVKRLSPRTVRIFSRSRKQAEPLAAHLIDSAVVDAKLVLNLHPLLFRQAFLRLVVRLSFKLLHDEILAIHDRIRSIVYIHLRNRHASALLHKTKHFNLCTH